MSESDNFQQGQQDKVRLVLQYKRYMDPDDWNRLNGHLIELFDGMHCPYISPIDSHMSDAAILVSSRELPPEEAQRIYDNWDWEYEEKIGRA